MKYCSGTTINHPIAQSHKDCINDINKLIAEEGFTCSAPVFSSNEMVLNLDLAEEIIAKIQKRSKNKSMDMALGLKSMDSTIKEMLMIEFKFNMTSFYNLKKSELEGKVQGSTLVLSNILPIHNLFIFIFKSNNVQEAKNRISRMIPALNINYIIMDIPELKSTYF